MGGFVKTIADPLDLIGARAADKKADAAQAAADEALRQVAAASEEEEVVEQEIEIGDSDEELRRRRARGASILAPRDDQALGGTISRPGAQTLG